MTSTDPTRPIALELLAPARDADTAIAAIDHGADAVYMGGPAFGARAAAANSIADLRRVADYAHRFRCRLYVTFNTILYDNELEQARRMVYDLYGAGVDAIIVQDMALTQMQLPPIALHASTQCDTRTPEQARFLQDAGFQQIVPARELSLDELRAITRAVSVPVEAFVHGALCVSYSGDCHASAYATGRSANRGNCSQMCRLAYTLTDGSGRQVAPPRHYLSLKDMNRLSRLGEMIDAGVRSFKIEGRLKDVAYVKETVAAYSQALDAIIAANPGRYRRASAGKSELTFTPSVDKAFNRGFTSYFLTPRPPRLERGMASMITPKSMGSPVATVTSVRPDGAITVSTENGCAIHNGDGLGYVDASGTFAGFRVNRADRNTLYPAKAVAPGRGTLLYRNRDKERDDMLAGKTARRTIGLNLRLSAIDGGLRLDASDCRGVKATATTACDIPTARTPQRAQRLQLMERLGDTIYTLDEFDDALDESAFVPRSVLASLRRAAIDSLDATAAATYRAEPRLRPSSDAGASPYGSHLTYHRNVANRLARKFYADHGALTVSPALEVERPVGETVVMTTRYCLRRELGACLLSPQADRLPRDLYLNSGSLRLRVDCHCDECTMQLVAGCKT